MRTHPMRGNARILVASTVGTAVEYYDFYVYGLAAATVFGPLFFPTQSPAAQTLLALMTFGIAFFARPVGAVAFGHFGDKVGRKSTLVASLLLMGGCTFAVAFLPTYAMAGWLGPALLCAMRFGQGFGLGGEWAGAALLSVENAPPGWQARFGMMPALGSTLGNTCAISVFLLLGATLSPADFQSWGWRLPFLLSALLVALGLWVRLKINETPAFCAALEREPPPRVPIVRLFADHAGTVLLCVAAMLTGFSLVYMAGPFALAQATGPLAYDRNSFLLLQWAASLCAIPALFAAARLADRRSLALTLEIGTLATVPIGFVFGAALGSGSLALAGAALCAANFTWGVTAASGSAWMSSLFPVRVRYSGFALAFNTAGILGGAVMPILAQLISAQGARPYVGLLLSAGGLLSFIAVKWARSAQSAARPYAPGLGV